MPDPRKKTVEDLFARLSARQFGTLEEVLDDDAVFDVAYSPERSSFPNPVKGAKAIQDMFETGVASMFSRLDFKVLETYLGQESDVIVVEYASSGVAAPTGRPYSNAMSASSQCAVEEWHDGGSTTIRSAWSRLSGAQAAGHREEALRDWLGRHGWHGRRLPADGGRRHRGTYAALGV